MTRDDGRPEWEPADEPREDERAEGVDVFRGIGYGLGATFAVVVALWGVYVIVGWLL